MNATLADILGTLGAFALFPLVLVVPGYVVGYAANLFRFREQDGLTRAMWGLVLSVAVCPVLTYYFGRFAGYTYVWALYGPAWIAFVGLLVRGRVPFPGGGPGRLGRVARVAIFAGCILAACLVLADLEIGETLIRTRMSDYLKHVSVTDAVTRTGIPPANPSYYPGEPLPLFYYYFWFMMCSLVDVFGGAGINAREAVLASVIWSGLLLASFLRVFLQVQGARVVPGLKAVHHKWLVLLLLITGLDLIPDLVLAVMEWTTGVGAVVESVEWWNEQVPAWIHAVMWVPHHVAAVVCCLLAAMVLNELVTGWEEGTRRQKAAVVAVGACALVSALGMSIWVTLTAGLALVVWVLLSLVRGWKDELAPHLMVGILAVLVALPFVVDLQRVNHLDEFPVALTVRHFFMIDRYTTDLPELVRNFVRLLSLPLNYMFEFGFFVLGGLLYWNYRKEQDTSLNRPERVLLVFFGVSLLVSTFLRSVIDKNDLGWRAVMLTQFVLVLYSAPLFLEVIGKPLRSSFFFQQAVRKTAVVMLVIGLLGTVTEIVLMRVNAMDEKGRVALDLRRTFEWVDAHADRDAIVQVDANRQFSHFAALYGFRQVVLADQIMGSLYGINEDMFQSLSDPIFRLFRDTTSIEEVLGICKAYGIDYLVARSSDPIWSTPEGWIWQIDPVFETGNSRVFDVESLKSKTGWHDESSTQ